MKTSKKISSSVFAAAACTSALQPVNTGSALNSILEAILRNILKKFCSDEKVNKIINYIDELFSSSKDDDSTGPRQEDRHSSANIDEESNSNRGASSHFGAEENRQLIGYYFKDREYTIYPFVNRILSEERKVDVSYSQEIVLGTMYLQVYDKISGRCALFPATEENVVYIVNTDSNGKRSYDKYNFNLMQKITYNELGYSVQNSWRAFTAEEFKNISFINEAHKCFELIKIYDKEFYKRFKSVAALPSFSLKECFNLQQKNTKDGASGNKSMAQLAQDFQTQNLFLIQQLQQNYGQANNFNNQNQFQQ